LKKDKHKRKKQIHLEGQSLNFFYQRYLQKRGYVIERIFRGPWSVNYQEQFTYLVCEKYVVQTFNSSSLSKIKLPFQKVVFTRHIVRVSGENKSIICSSCLGRMSFYNN
jgi:hypothetical protein